MVLSILLEGVGISVEYGIHDEGKSTLTESRLSKVKVCHDGGWSAMVHSAIRSLDWILESCYIPTKYP